MDATKLMVVNNILNASKKLQGIQKQLDAVIGELITLASKQLEGDHDGLHGDRRHEAEPGEPAKPKCD